MIDKENAIFLSGIFLVGFVLYALGIFKNNEFLFNLFILFGAEWR